MSKKKTSKPTSDRKRKANIARHGIDFADCEAIFDSPVITREDDREAYGEQRLQSYGIIEGIVVFLCWVEREHGPHLISIRKAKRYEQKYYFSQIGY